MENYWYTILDVNYDTGMARVSDSTLHSSINMPINTIKQMYRNGLHIEGVVEDTLGRLRLSPVNPAETSVVVGNELLKKIDRNTEPEQDLALEMYSMLPDIIYPDNNYRRDLANKMSDYAKRLNTNVKKFTTFSIGGAYGIMCGINFNIPNNAPIKLLIAVCAIVSTNNSTRFNIEPAFHLIDIKHNRIIYSSSLNISPEDNMSRVPRIMHEYLISSEIDNSMTGKDINLGIHTFKGSYSWTDNTLYKILNSKFKMYCIRQIPDTRIIHEYLMGIIYGYYGKVVRLETLRLFNKNLHTGIKWSMCFEDGTEIRCRIDAPILNSKNIMLRYTSNNKEVCVSLDGINNYKNINHRVIDDKCLSSVLNNQVLDRLFTGAGDKYHIVSNADTVMYNKLSSEIGNELVSSSDICVYEITSRMISELNGSFPNVKFGENESQLEAMMCKRRVNIHIRIDNYSQDTKNLSLRYLLGDTSLYVNSLRIKADERKPFSKLGVLKDDKLDQIIRTINRDIENIVKPQLVYMH